MELRETPRFVTVDNLGQHQIIDMDRHAAVAMVFNAPLAVRIVELLNVHGEVDADILAAAPF